MGKIGKTIQQFATKQKAISEVFVLALKIDLTELPLYFLNPNSPRP